MSTETLEFENGRTLQQLFANDPRLLKTLEKRIGIRATARDGWLQLEGKEEGVKAAKEIFQQLDSIRRKGVSIGKHEFQYAMRTVLNEEEGGGGNGDVTHLYDTRIKCSPKKPAVVAKTTGQKEYIEAIAKNDLVFGIGPAGTGKTFLAMAMAVAALKREEVSRIILTRPAVEAGEALGFLPGDLQEKIFPYLRPLYDALHDMLEVEEIQKYMDRGVLEVAPLAYMRGRTLNKAFVVLDEAQNTTQEQMFMFLTRLGAESKCVVTGDKTQVDLPPNKRSGLVEAIQALRNVDGACFCYFRQSDVVRHPLVQSIINAYQAFRRGEPLRAEDAEENNT